MGMVVAEPRLQDELLLRTRPRQIGVFGGTFNPIHNGHLMIAQQAAREFALDRVLFMVAADPPHKHQRKDLAPKEARFHMVEAALAPYPQFEPFSLELLRDGPSYTVDTMEQLHELKPNADWHFIIGEDALYQLEGWHEFPELARLTDFICMRRPMEQHKEMISPELQAQILRTKYGTDVHLSDFTGPNISSTEIRERLGRGESIKGLVPKSVEDIIYATGLYQQ